MPLKKKLTIKDFVVIPDGDNLYTHIRDKEMQKVLGKRRYKEFAKFMFGQTCPIDSDNKLAYYPWDVENFLRPPHRRFFD